MSLYTSDRQEADFPGAVGVLRGLEALIAGEEALHSTAGRYAKIIRALLSVVGAPSIEPPHAGQNYPYRIKHPDRRVEEAVAGVAFYADELTQLGLLPPPKVEGGAS